VISLGWTSSEDLVVILEEGNMCYYDIHGQHKFTRVITRVSII